MDPLPSKSPLLTLSNELFFEVASHLESFKDLNSLLCTSRFFHTLFNNHLYRRAVAAEDFVRRVIVRWVLSEYRVASLTLLLDNGLPVHQKLLLQMFGMADMLRWILYSCSSDHERSVPLVRLLLDRGADIEPDDDYQGTVLHTAVRQGNCLIVSLLLARGADPNATDYNGKTPLHFAFGCALEDGLFMVKLLLKNGAHVNAADVNGRTPLHHACLGNRFPLAQILLENGANVNAVSKLWGSPLQLASSTFSHDVVTLLIAHGAKDDKDVI
jgi:hypothetical protein